MSTHATFQPRRMRWVASAAPIPDCGLLDVYDSEDGGGEGRGRGRRRKVG